ncbi:Domain of Kin17 curved DNA-binding family protein [Clavispora lusitaniae]|uniref:Domain of Kin17 curved DNA-binding family protein n=1 Tax=Clavispora lusitaniae TaxID=36911 RepID=UPI00202BC1D8|nr:Domain of Kin17 curved DNA-binding family protein [Clavispora lusitaniae]
MGKAEFGSAKYQAKQLKASGLQKLRYYCQLCRKQCRDANGFKNHLSSPSHMGRISNLSSDGKAGSVVEEFSAQFERDFMRLLRINHGTKKIDANKFYQEYILNDRDHVHMNATKWSSLTSFIRYLGRQGKVRVEMPDAEDEFNLVIRLPETTAPAKKKAAEADEERTLKFLQQQVEHGKQLEQRQEKTTSANNSDMHKDKQDEEASKQEASEGKTQAAKASSSPGAPIKLSLKGLVTKKRPVASAFSNDSDSDTNS